MINTQLLNDALTTVALIVGVVVAISAWVAAAAGLHRRQAHTTQIRVLEEHLTDAAEHSPVPVG